MDEFWRQLQLLTRHRRDLVRKASTLCCQIKEQLDVGAARLRRLLPDAVGTPGGVDAGAAKPGGADDLRQAGRARLRSILNHARIGFQQRTLDRVMEWAKNAAAPDIAAAHHRRIAADLEADRQRKELEIQGLEREIAALLVRTPYVLLMSIPGVNVVSAAEYAAEMGPICNYANARCITGRAGLYPSPLSERPGGLQRQDWSSAPTAACASPSCRSPTT